MPPLKFKKDESSQKIRAQSNNIGWLHSIADKPGAKFDITIKDSLGREKLKKINCGSEHEKYGELINLPIVMGEELEIVVDNIKGAEMINIFVN